MRKLIKRITSLLLACLMVVGMSFCFDSMPVMAATPSVSMTLTPTSTGFTVKVSASQSFASMGATQVVISGPNKYQVYTAKSDLNKSSMSWSITMADADTRLDTYTFTVRKTSGGSTTTIATVSKTSSFVIPVSNLKATKYGTGLKISWTQPSKYYRTVYISVKDNTTKSTVYSTSVNGGTTSVVMPKYNSSHSYTVTVKNKNRAGYYSVARTYNVLAMP